MLLLLDAKYQEYYMHWFFMKLEKLAFGPISSLFWPKNSKQIFPQKIIQVSFKSSHYCSFMQKNPAKFHALIFDRIPSYIYLTIRKKYSQSFLGFSRISLKISIVWPFSNTTTKLRSMFKTLTFGSIIVADWINTN